MPIKPQQANPFRKLSHSPSLLMLSWCILGLMCFGERSLVARSKPCILWCIVCARARVLPCKIVNSKKLSIFVGHRVLPSRDVLPSCFPCLAKRIKQLWASTHQTALGAGRRERMRRSTPSRRSLMRRSGEQVGKVMRNGGGSVQCVLVTCLVPRVLLSWYCTLHWLDL